MHISLSKTLISCCLVFLLPPYVTGQTARSCDEAKFTVSKFVNSKKNEDWDKIEAGSYKLSNCKCEMAPVFYYIYRMKVLLPNSHSLQGISPNDFIASQKLKMHEQIKTLQHCEQKLYLPLIETMTKQNFDSDIADSAKDLSNKLKRKI